MDRMIIYLSGGGTVQSEELNKRSHIMLTFADNFGKKKPQKRIRELLEGLKVGSMFLDSGSFSLWKKAEKFAQEGNSKWAFYDTKEHWEYLEAYATFVLENQRIIGLYANIDVIPDRNIDSFNKDALDHMESLSWRNQQFLEKQGLDPIPVVHYRADLKWLHHYLELGYERIALGGLVGSHGQEHCRGWLDRAFDIICNTKDRTPLVRTHGFGVTSHELLFRYPWATVDSTSWLVHSAYNGAVIVPVRKGKEWQYRPLPHVLYLTEGKSTVVPKTIHYFHREGVRNLLHEWLEHIDIPVGDLKRIHDEKPPAGVLHHHGDRLSANFRYYERLGRHLPEYPQSYARKARPNFGFV